jgi:hypothetical protein
MSHPIVGVFVVIYIVEIFAFGPFCKEWVRSEKANVVVNSTREYIPGFMKELFGGPSLIFIGSIKSGIGHN